MSELDSPITEQEFRYYSARPSWQWIDFPELWRYRDLIWMFALRDLKVRYRQTAVGIAWALIQPLFTVIVFGVLFSVMNAEATTSGAPYAVTALCALLPWQLFATTLTHSTESVVMNKQLVTKVYFPRVILPIATLIPALVDFAISFSLLILLMLYYGIFPGWPFLILPVMMIIALITSLAFALWLSALNAIYRDVQYIVPFLIQSGLFISPVVYESEIVVKRIPESLQWLYWLNPMVGVIEGFRWAVLGTQTLYLSSLMISLTAMCLVLFGGMFYFRRMERFFADRI